MSIIDLWVLWAMNTLLDPTVGRPHQHNPCQSCNTSVHSTVVTRCLARLSILQPLTLPAQTLLLDVWDQQDPWRLRWDSVVLVALTYVIIVTPWIIAFEISTVSGTLMSNMSQY